MRVGGAPYGRQIGVLKSNLHGEVYVEQLVGFIVTVMEYKALKLRNAQFGLHQALRA
jgi:hypothetical protein